MRSPFLSAIGFFARLIPEHFCRAKVLIAKKREEFVTVGKTSDRERFQE